jgi:hypothetical protein
LLLALTVTLTVALEVTLVGDPEATIAMTLAVALAVILVVTFQTMTLQNTVLGVVGAAIITVSLTPRATVTVNPNVGVEGIGNLTLRATVTINPLLPAGVTVADKSL